MKFKRITDNLNERIRNWYRNEYPDDDYGYDINPDYTFEDIYNNGFSYKDSGVYDSLIRERIFKEFSKRTGFSYDEIYDNFWIDD